MPIRVTGKHLSREEESVSPQVQQDLERPTAIQIYAQVAKNARKELRRSARSLAVSGFAGGITMGLTGLATAIARAELGTSGIAQFVTNLLYPVGFIAVILGRAQLFTENTLYPVALVLSERRHYLATLRLWAIVLVFNCLGTLAFAALMVRTDALQTKYVDSLVALALETANHSISTIFWSAIIGGWIIALVAWLVSASHSISGSMLLIWLLAFIVGLGHFAHSIASSGEVLAAVLHHQLAFTDYLRWLWPAVLGNIVGGVGLVTLLEYGQTAESDQETGRRP
ncbi:MAG TPA: formate/nitrite transporter family protein [Acidobacteriaceae bacterium]|jgi:formate/nitrite transporter FocA (FNT family)